jgi:hypothetical protein
MPLGDFVPQTQAATLKHIRYNDAKQRDLEKMEGEGTLTGDPEAKRPPYTHVSGV